MAQVWGMDMVMIGDIVTIGLMTVRTKRNRTLFLRNRKKPESNLRLKEVKGEH